jgi:hypothetical protein
MISPTAHAFWSHWRDEKRAWEVVELQPTGFVATDRSRFLRLDPSFNQPMEQTFVAEHCATRELAYTFIALRCTQYALEKLGVV